MDGSPTNSPRSHGRTPRRTDIGSHEVAPDASARATHSFAAVGRTPVAGPGFALAVSIVAAALFTVLARITFASAIQAFDERAVRAVAVYRGPWFDRVMVELTALADGGVVLATAGVLAVFLWLLRHRRAAYFLAAAVIGGLALLAVLKLSFDRPRPLSTEWGTAAMSHAFPSGHAMSVVVLYGAILYLLPRLGAGAVLRRISRAGVALLILLVGFSRVALGVHYPSDVLAGYLAGLAWIALVIAVADRAWIPRG